MRERFAFATLKRDTPNGIEFQDGKRMLYHQGQPIAEGRLSATLSPYDYYYNLRFVEDFPQITHWAFGDAWTQKVLIHKPNAFSGDLVGSIHFASEDDTGTYIIERNFGGVGMDTAPIVQPPMPSLFHIPLNLPLRIALAKMILWALDDDLPYDQWHFVSSLVPRDDVPQVFAPDIVAAHGFHLRAVPDDLRLALCQLQGIRG